MFYHRFHPKSVFSRASTHLLQLVDRHLAYELHLLDHRKLHQLLLHRGHSHRHLLLHHLTMDFHEFLPLFDGFHLFSPSFSLLRADISTGFTLPSPRFSYDFMVSSTESPHALITGRSTSFCSFRDTCTTLLPHGTCPETPREPSETPENDRKRPVFHEIPMIFPVFHRFSHRFPRFSAPKARLSGLFGHLPDELQALQLGHLD